MDPRDERAPFCASIRAKGFFVHVEEAPPPPETDTAVFWCARTQTTIGPDGDVVLRSCCTPERPCFEVPT